MAGELTDWLAARREGQRIPLPPKVAEMIAKELFNRVMLALKGKFFGRINLERMEDATADTIAELLQAMADPLNGDLVLLAKVVDTPSFAAWLYLAADNKLSAYLKTKDASNLRYSEMSRIPEGLRENLDLIVVDLAECVDAAVSELEGMRSVDGREAKEVFNAVFLKGLSQTEAAEALHFSDAKVHRRLRWAKFHIACRLGWTPDELTRNFGAEDTQQWLLEGLKDEEGNSAKAN